MTQDGKTGLDVPTAIDIGEPVKRETREVPVKLPARPAPTPEPAKEPA